MIFQGQWTFGILFAIFYEYFALYMKGIRMVDGQFNHTSQMYAGVHSKHMNESKTHLSSGGVPEVRHPEPGTQDPAPSTQDPAPGTRHPAPGTPISRRFH